MTLPVLLASLPEITPGGKLIICFWSVWGLAILIGFVAQAFKVDESVLAYDRAHKKG